MLSLEQAQEQIAQAVRAAQETETLPLTQAQGRYLAAEVAAVVANPAFDNSAMDGYAVAIADLTDHDPSLPLVGESACGSAPASLAPGSCMRIFTGAPVPAGADAVVIQEDVQLHEDKVIFSSKAVRSGQNIRRQGEDFAAGETLFTSGQRLTAYDLALLSAAGVALVPLYRRARALVVATGNELVQPGTPLRAGQIYESNRLATLLQLQQMGIDVTDGGMVADNAQALRALLCDAVDYDFVITSGGVSVGDYDLVKQVFAEIGDIDFWKVRIKPGKPVAFGHIGERTHFFGLPGNPVSSLVTFALFVRPALVAWSHGKPQGLVLNAIADNSLQRQSGRTEFVRAHLRSHAGQLYARALPGQGSHMLGTLRQTNGFIRVEHDSSGFVQGETVQAIPLSLDIETA